MEGKHLRRSKLTNQYWKPAVKRAGLEPFKFHELRHTAATLALEAGVDLYDVSRMLGHANISITSDTYGHLSDARRDFLADAIQRNAEILTQFTQDDDSGKVVGINRRRNIGPDQGQ